MKAYAELVILSTTLTPDVLDTVLGLKSDKRWTTGQLRANSTISEKQNGWVIQSCLDRTAPLEEHINHLLDTLRPASSKIKGLSGQACVQFSCVVHAPDVPPLHFDSGVITALSELGASLDIDLYLLSEEP